MGIFSCNGRGKTGCPLSAGRCRPEQDIQLFGEERVVIPRIQPEERKRLDERSTPDDKLRTPPGEQIQRGELLEDAHRVGRGKHRDRAGQANRLRQGCGAGQDHGGRAVEILRTVMFAEAEVVETGLIGGDDLFNQVGHPVYWSDGGRDGGKTVDSDLHAGFDVSP
jgi:hypothetical protein